MRIGKAAITTPIYFSFAWLLIMSYQLFTEMAVSTILRELNVLWPNVGAWLISKTGTLVFVYAFSWLFLLSSVIPSWLVGKRKGTLIQFIIVLLLTVSVSFFETLFVSLTEFEIDKVFNLTVYLNNPLDAATYLMLPYIIMLVLDLSNRRNEKAENTLVYPKKDP